jgi:hypothetical protein
MLFELLLLTACPAALAIDPELPVVVLVALLLAPVAALLVVPRSESMKALPEDAALFREEMLMGGIPCRFVCRVRT